MLFHHQKRLDRALHHLERLKAEAGAWADESPYRTWTNLDVDGRYKLTWLEATEQPPAHLSLIVGDCVHNLRSSLDNLMLELAFVYKRGRVSKGIEGDSMFPIFTTDIAQDPECLKKFNRMARGIDPKAKSIIEGLQPYKRGDWFQHDPLWQLNWLNIEDKHRLPHVVLFARMGQAFFVPEHLSIDDIEYIHGTVESRAPIARYPAFDKTGAEVDIQVTPTPSVGFGQRVPPILRSMPVPMRLGFTHHHIVSKVLRPLRPFLKRQ